jgi:hypothetical protein
MNILTSVLNKVAVKVSGAQVSNKGLALYSPAVLQTVSVKSLGKLTVSSAHALWKGSGK